MRLIQSDIKKAYVSLPYGEKRVSSDLHHVSVKLCNRVDNQAKVLIE